MKEWHANVISKKSGYNIRSLLLALTLLCDCFFPGLYFDDHIVSSCPLFSPTQTPPPDNSFSELT